MASKPSTPSAARRPARLVVLVSGSGSNLQALLDAVAADRLAAESAGKAESAGITAPTAPTESTGPGDSGLPGDPGSVRLPLGAEVVAVGADRGGIAGLERAERAGVPTFVCRVKDYDTRAEWDAALAEATAAHEPDLVVSAGFMKIVGKEFLARFGGRYINTHPALLPSFPGAHGVRDALAYGAKVTGCTVHFADEGVDTGPIIAQQAVEVRDEDDEAALHERIKEVERALLVEVVGRLARNDYRIEGRKVVFP
ncbi:phosphoribosylglycinamide formyltransferase [Streptomyces sp. CAU 1734]|uniref:phosphoribosylglycinamide formyltransferase n=1 Tax=Streptomyces sp. CAU 1734 TaxID=3140360 RepID=UPI003260A452